MSCEGDVQQSGTEAPVRYSHKVHLLDNREIKGETTHLVRLRREADHHMAFFLKKSSDFVDLQHQLQKDSQERMWGDATEIIAIPEMPTPGRFGIRKRLSMLGMNDFVAVQAEQIQQGMDKLMFQVTDLSKDSTLTTFFTESTDAATKDVINDWVFSFRSQVHLLAVMGFWRLGGSKHTWIVHSDGTASMDGRHTGDQYDFVEEGDLGSLGQRIVRKDGWSVDLDRSSRDKLIWVAPGQQELVWSRMQKDEAEAALKQAGETKLSIKKRKEEEQRLEQAAERARTRQAILERAAAARARKADVTDSEPGKQDANASGTSTENEGATTSKVGDEDVASTAASEENIADLPLEEEKVSKAPSMSKHDDEEAAGMTTFSEEAAGAPPDADADALAGTPKQVAEGSN